MSLHHTRSQLGSSHLQVGQINTSAVPRKLHMVSTFQLGPRAFPLTVPAGPGQCFQLCVRTRSPRYNEGISAHDRSPYRTALEAATGIGAPGLYMTNGTLPFGQGNGLRHVYGWGLYGQSSPTPCTLHAFSHSAPRLLRLHQWQPYWWAV